MTVAAKNIMKAYFFLSVIMKVCVFIYLQVPFRFWFPVGVILIAASEKTIDRPQCSHGKSESFT